MEFPRLKFSSAADNSRPFGSHRYDVYGPKIQRRLFLYGELALNGFMAIESDPEIFSYCERPIVITCQSASNSFQLSASKSFQFVRQI